MSALEKSIHGIAEELTRLSKKEQPSVFNKDFWTGRMMEFAMKDPAFKVEMFRFVDVFSVLKTPEQVSQHLKEYFLRPEQEIPASIQLLIRGAASGLGQKLGGSTIVSQITDMARKFIMGENEAQALPILRELRKEKVGFTLDLLGESALSEEESLTYLDRYSKIVTEVSAEAKSWEPVPLLDHDPLGEIPKVNVSIKVSALFSAIDPLAFELSVRKLYDRLLPLLVSAKEKNVFVNFDLEQYALKDLTYELFRRLRSAPELSGYPHLGVVVQAYLRDAEEDAEALIKFAKKSKQNFTIRLVKGAYWDYETISAKQKGWPAPVFEVKHETDAAYENIAATLLDNYPQVRLAVGSHNLRSVAHTMAYARKNKLPTGAYEVQMLYGMAEPIRKALVSMGERVRVYAPIGALLPGMAYLVRRLLENTSNEGFLRQRFVEERALPDLLKAPEPAAKKRPTLVPPVGFYNEPLRDFAVAHVREQFDKTLAAVKQRLPIEVPVVVSAKKEKQGGQKRVNPARTSEVVAEVSYATPAQADRAVTKAAAALCAWRARPVAERAAILERAAEIFSDRRDEISALMVYEVGKTPREADADVCEAIDFCRYYADEAKKLFGASAPERTLDTTLLTPPGESNVFFYEPRGVAVVIAPWNFPCAILCGMTVAALVTGNTVVMKAAEQSSAVGYAVFEVLQKAGVPDDVLHFIPGQGEVVGAALAQAKDTALVAFTGSRQVGLALLKGAGDLAPGQDHIRKVILELGGKNAIIVDDDADLDEAVVGVVQSAFGYQGQKCSACSRVIVVGERHDEFVERLVQATKTLRLGAPDDLANNFGPLIDDEAQQRLKQAIADGKTRLKVALGDDAAFAEGPTMSQGYFVSPTIFLADNDRDPLAQEELFGPLLVVLRARDFEHALAIANGTSYALTGGVFTRSPEHLEVARRDFRVGNLYLNRGITGALVGRQPFGGLKMSGIGSKAGGPDYLLQFVEPRVVTENTMRRGFAPES